MQGYASNNSRHGLDRALWRVISGGSLVLALALLATGCPSTAPAPSTPAALPVQLKSLTLVTYDTAHAWLNVQGLLTTGDATTLTVVRFYSNSTCTAPTLGAGTAGALNGSGIPITVSSASPTPIYAQTNTDDFCVLLTTYQPTHVAPPPATFTSTVPTSPSHVSYAPIVFGTVSSSTSQVLLFDDAGCHHGVGSGPGSGFSSTGIAVTLAPNTTSSLYDITVEPFGNSSACTALTTYTHSVLNPGAPGFTAIVPPSPSNTSTTPTITGTLSATSVSVALFGDSGCQTQLASGSTSAFEVAGIQVTVAANASTAIYAQATDSAGNVTPCTYLTTFVNNTVAPAAPSFTLVNPVTPTRLTIYPLVVGAAAPNTAVVELFNGAACTTQIGSGTATQFAGTGIRAGVASNAVTTIYAADVDAAGNASACTHMVDFTNDTVPPDPPGFSSTNPVSPNNKSYTPLVTGTTDSKTVSIKLFNDVTCGNLIGLGTTADFTGAGIQVTAGINVTTAIYAEGFDDVGNVSACTLLTDYGYSNLAAPAPVFTVTSPTSPSNSSTTPWVLGTAATTVAMVQLFSDVGCLTEIGHGSRIGFETIGVQATVPANTNSNIYAMSTDVYGNQSPCVLLTAYLHDNIPPLAPTYTAASPVSPNNTSGTPIITGTAPGNPASLLGVSTVTLYDSPSCVTKLGTGSPSTFSTTGITATVYLNADTSIYAKSEDAATNTSPCTYLADYIYDTLSPGKPIFGSVTPASPSYGLRTIMTGSIHGSTDIESAVSINVYSDPVCSQPLANGSVAAFESVGISIPMPENATTTLYGQVTDVVGNLSTCAQLTIFQQADLGPSGALAAMNPDGSVGVTWIPDGVASPTPTYIIQRSLWSGGPYTIIAQGVSGNSYRDTSTTNGATYYYTVAATNSTGTSRNSAESGVSILVATPPAPTTLVATPGPAQVTLTWGGSSSIMNYSVYRGIKTGGPYTQIATGVPSTTYMDLTVSNGAGYFYVVTGVNPAGESSYSNEAGVIPEALPSAPTGLIATPTLSLPQCGGSSGVLLSWSAPSYYQQFNVKRSTSSGGESTLVTVTAPPYADCSPSYNSSQFPNGTPNYYEITATWGVSESGASNEVGFVNVAAPLVSANPGNGLGVISWSSEAGATGYNLLRGSQSGGPYTAVASNIAGTSYVDSAVANGTAYYYVVVDLFAGNLAGWPSLEANLTPGVNPSAPSHLDLRVQSNTPYLNWSSPANFDSFNVYRASTSGGTYSLLSNVATNSFQDAAPLLGMNWYKVTALWGSTETSATNTVSYRSGIPGTISAVSATSTITITWGAVAGISHYNVLRATSSGGSYTSIATPATSPYVDSTVTAGTGYFYVVYASFADGTSGQYSAQVSGMAGSSKVPSGLTVTLTSGNSVTLQWASVLSATSYKVYDSTTSGGPYTYTGTASATTTATISSLNSNHTYYFVVTSLVSGTESAKSSQVAGYTASAPSSPLVTAGNAQVVLSWPPVSGVLSYSLLRSTDSVSYATVASGLSSTNYTDTTAVNGTLYFYEVTALFATVNLTSLASTGVTPGVVPLVPAGVTVVANSDGTDVTLTWSDVPGATGYNIYQATTSGGPYGVPVGTTSSSSANVVSGLTAGTTYYYVVTALIGSEESGQSTQVAVIPAVTPPAPTVVAGASTTANISWGAVTGAATYDLQRSPDGINFTTISSSQAAKTYADSGLTAAEPYQYRYLPRGASGVAMAFSAVSQPETPGVPSLTPSELTADTNGTTVVDLSWLPLTNVTSYNVYRGGASGGPYTLLGSVISPTTIYADSTVSAGNSYFYVVTSVNSSGVESVYSNQAAVTLLAAPSGVSASSVDNQINVTWSTLGGAASYIVKKSLSASGPFGVLATGIASTTYSDSQVVAGTTYYYEIAAVMGSGLTTPDSSVASAVGTVTVNLQVPIEMTDEALASGTSPTTFLRTQTTFDPTAYDGVDTYFLEVVATNSDTSPHNVTVYDNLSNACATLAVPASTVAPTRLRANFTPDGALTPYALALDATTASGQLVILSARLLINQSGATRTRIYIPLLGSTAAPSNLDATAPVATTSATSYAEIPDAMIYNRNTSVLKALAANNAWELETVTAASGGAVGYVGLYDTTRSAELPDTQTDFQSATPELSLSPFDDGITDFAAPTNEGDNYELLLECGSGCSGGAVSVYKAGLWVNLGPLTQAEVTFRDSLGAASVSSATVIDLERTLVDLTLFSNPVIYFQSVAQVGASGSLAIALMSDGTQDSGTSSLSAVTGSTLTFSGAAKSRQRTGAPITLTTGNRYLPQATPSGGASPSIISTSVVVDVTH